MALSARRIPEMRCGLVAVLLLVAGLVCISTSQMPEAISSYALMSWQNRPNQADQTDHKLVHQGSLMACTNVEPKKAGNECLLKYQNDGEMYIQFHQTITATSSDEVSLTCVSKEPTEPISCEVTITELKYQNPP